MSTDKKNDPKKNSSTVPKKDNDSKSGMSTNKSKTTPNKKK